MRLFIAAEVPEAIRDAIERDVVVRLRGDLAGARWTRPEGRHLTLTFLGEVDDARVDAIGDAAAMVAARHAPFEAAFAELGGFPSLGRPRVLWLGLGAGAGPMAALAGDLDRALVPLGIPPEDRPFRAHLTLARIARPRALDVPPSAPVPATPFSVEAAVLFRSQLHPKGARYTPLRRLPLGAV